MNYNNYAFINASNLYIKWNNQNVILNFQSSILNNGIIENKIKFTKQIEKYLKDELNVKFLWNKKITIIYNDLVSQNDVDVIESVFNNLGFKQVNIKSFKSIINITKNDAIMILNQNLRLFYIDKYNRKKHLILNTNELKLKEIENLIIPRCQKKNVYVLDSNIKIENLLEKNKIKYYIYENLFSFFEKNYF